MTSSANFSLQCTMCQLILVMIRDVKLTEFSAVRTGMISTSISHFYIDHKAHGSDEADQYKCILRSLLVTVLLCLNSRGCFHTAQHDSQLSTHCHTLLGALVLLLDTRGREGGRD